jgi:hypothetical protein
VADPMADPMADTQWWIHNNRSTGIRDINIGVQAQKSMY